MPKRGIESSDCQRPRISRTAACKGHRPIRKLPIPHQTALYNRDFAVAEIPLDLLDDASHGRDRAFQNLGEIPGIIKQRTRYGGWSIVRPGAHHYAVELRCHIRRAPLDPVTAAIYKSIKLSLDIKLSQWLGAGAGEGERNLATTFSSSLAGTGLPK